VLRSVFLANTFRFAALSTYPPPREPKHCRASRGHHQSVPADHMDTVKVPEAPFSRGDQEPEVTGDIT